MYSGMTGQVKSILFRYVTVPVENIHGNHKPT